MMPTSQSPGRGARGRHRGGEHEPEADVAGPGARSAWAASRGGEHEHEADVAEPGARGSHGGTVVNRVRLRRGAAEKERVGDRTVGPRIVCDSAAAVRPRRWVRDRTVGPWIACDFAVVRVRRAPSIACESIARRSGHGVRLGGAPRHLPRPRAEQGPEAAERKKRRRPARSVGPSGKLRARQFAMPPAPRRGLVGATRPRKQRPRARSEGQRAHQPAGARDALETRRIEPTVRRPWKKPDVYHRKTLHLAI
jgi:hypothetical protein